MEWGHVSFMRRRSIMCSWGKELRYVKAFLHKLCTLVKMLDNVSKWKTNGPIKTRINVNDLIRLECFACKIPSKHNSNKEAKWNFLTFFDSVITFTKHLTRPPRVSHPLTKSWGFPKSGKICSTHWRHIFCNKSWLSE